MAEVAPVGMHSEPPTVSDISSSTTSSTKLTNKCTKCLQLMREGVEYRDRIWHRECLTCSNCADVLAGTRFTNIDGRPYCFQCYTYLFAYKCDACSQPIHGLGDGFLVYMEDRRWHIGCFRCSSCDAALLGEISFCSVAKGALCQICANLEDG